MPNQASWDSTAPGAGLPARIAPGNCCKTSQTCDHATRVELSLVELQNL
jgi:hypothetical protein